MLHIILTVLKITGILLLMLLLLVIGIIAAVLLVPLRYRLLAVHTGEDTHGEARITWLLHLVSVRVMLRLPTGNDSGSPPGAFQISFCILGISPQKVSAFFKNRKGHPAGKKKKESSKNKHGNEERKPTAAQKKHVNEGPKPSTAQKEHVNTAQKPSTAQKEHVNTDEKPPMAQKKHENDDRELTFSQREQPAKEQSSKSSRIHSIPMRLEKFFTGLLNKIRSFGGTIRKIPKQLQHLKDSILKAVRKPGELVQKLSDFRQKLERYDAEETVREVWNRILQLLRHFRVRKGKGYLRFGTGDPALTGELTGILYLVLPVSCRDIAVEPQFTDTMLETELEAAGHIRLIHLASAALWAFRNRKLRRLIRAFRN